jgi:NTP pyrophosphatase (non-canonical NTP hydrolase)
MSDIKELTQKIIAFRDVRDWKQFHNPKDCAISLSLEAAEVLEHFQWKNEAEIKEYLKDHKTELAEELADVFNFLLLMCHDLEIDIMEVSARKLAINDQKYPVEKARGKHTKYNQL